MKYARQIHTYIGCLFAPLLIYFSLSGAWQIFNFHHHAQGEPPTASQALLHKLSNAHIDAYDHGISYKLFAFVMALGFVFSTTLGIQMGLKVKQGRRIVLLCLLMGAALPLLFLFVMAT